MKLILFSITLILMAVSHADTQIPNMEIKQIHQNVYLHKSYHLTESYGLVSSNGLVILEKNEAFIIDTPWSEKDTKDLITWIKEKGHKVAGSISTHSHEDRTVGIRILNEKSIPTYASKLTNELLKKQNKELAKNTIESDKEDLFKSNLEVFYPGAGHTHDNIVVWIKKHNILAGGCFVRSLGSKNLGYTGEASINTWAKSISKIQSNYPNIKQVIPGHGKPGDANLPQHTKSLAQAAATKASN